MATTTALIIIFTVLGVVIFLAYIGYRYHALFGYHYQVPKKAHQEPQFSLLNRKIILDDGYELTYNMAIYPESTHFFIGFHGLGASKESFGWFVKHARENRYSYLFFDQRNFGQNQPNATFDFKRLIIDCQKIIQLVHKQYAQNQRIVLIGHSLGAAIIAELTCQPAIQKLVFGCIFIGCVFKRHINPFIFFELSFKNVLNLILAVLFSRNRVIAPNFPKNLRTIYYQEYVTNIKKREIPLYYYSQSLQLSRNFAQNLADSQVKNLLVFRLGRDFFANLKLFDSFFNNLKRQKPGLIIKSAPQTEHVFDNDNASVQLISRLISQWIAET